MKITEEMIARAAAEADKTILDMYPDRYEEEHVFSEEFCRKMHEIDPDIDPVTGEIHKEDLDDLRAYEQAMEEYRKNPTTFSHEEVVKMLKEEK